MSSLSLPTINWKSPQNTHGHLPECNAGQSCLMYHYFRDNSQDLSLLQISRPHPGKPVQTPTLATSRVLHTHTVGLFSQVELKRVHKLKVRTKSGAQNTSGHLHTRVSLWTNNLKEFLRSPDTWTIELETSKAELKHIPEKISEGEYILFHRFQTTDSVFKAPRGDRFVYLVWYCVCKLK